MSHDSPAIAVFGRSDPTPSSPEYLRALDLGRFLARAGFVVLNGGYGGTMEASARGAHEAGGTARGVTTRAFAGMRPGPNPYIDIELCEDDLFSRTRRLISDAAGFVVLPGGVGTLAELAFLWALNKAGLLGPRPVILLGEIWPELFAELRRLDLIGERELAASIVAPDPREAVRILRDRLGR